MAPTTGPASDAPLTLTDVVQQADLESLIESLSQATDAPITLVDSSGQRLAGAGGEGRLAELVWPCDGDTTPEHLAGRLGTTDPDPVSISLGTAAVLLAVGVREAGESCGSIVAGPLLTVAPADLAPSGASSDELAAELGVEATAVRNCRFMETRWDEDRLNATLASLKTMARAFSLLYRYGRDVRRKQAEMEALYEIGMSLTSTLEMDRVLEQVLDKAIEHAGARKGSVMLLNEARDYLMIAKARGLSDEIIAEARVPMGEGISGWVAQENKPRIMLRGVRDLLSRSKRPREQMTSALSVPIRAREHVIGVINVCDRIQADNFDEEDLRILQMLAAPAGIALDNARVHGLLRAQEAQDASGTEQM